MTADAATQSTPKPTRRRWWQFSIVTLLLLAVIAGLAAGYYASAKRLVEAQEELLQAKAAIKVREMEVGELRGQLGYFEVTDPKLVHIRAVPIVDKARWKWRLYLPPSREWTLIFGHGHLEAFGSPVRLDQERRCRLPAGESSSGIEIERGKYGMWELCCLTASRPPEGYEMELDLANYLLLGGAPLMVQTGEFETEIIDPAKRDFPIMLGCKVELPREGPLYFEWREAPFDDPTKTGPFGIWVWLESTPLNTSAQP